MYHEWLDRWDERRAQRGDATKEPTDFALDGSLAFPGAESVASGPGFWALADRPAGDPAFLVRGEAGFEAQWDDGWFRFPSSLGPTSRRTTLSGPR